MKRYKATHIPTPSKPSPYLLKISRSLLLRNAKLSCKFFRDFLYIQDNLFTTHNKAINLVIKILNFTIKKLCSRQVKPDTNIL